MPSGSGPSVRGDVHGANASVPRRHSNVPGSDAVNVNCGVVTLIVPVGPDSIVVSGAAVSIVNIREAGVGSTLPAASVARTVNACVPSASVPRFRGDEHGWNVPVSSRHSNVDPDSLAENVNTGALLLVVPVGPVLIVVSGAVVSTVKVRVAGVGSTFPPHPGHAPRTCRSCRPKHPRCAATRTPRTRPGRSGTRTSPTRSR